LRRQIEAEAERARAIYMRIIEEPARAAAGAKESVMSVEEARKPDFSAARTAGRNSSSSELPGASLSCSILSQGRYGRAARPSCASRRHADFKKLKALVIA